MNFKFVVTKKMQEISSKNLLMKKIRKIQSALNALTLLHHFSMMVHKGH